VQGPANRVEVYGTGGWAIATNVFVPRLGAAGGRLTLSDGTARTYDTAPNPYELQVADFAAWTSGRDYAGTTGAEGAINVALLEKARDEAIGGG
jgi:hypothetical protein